jgi:hypothetical protein
MGLSTTEPGVRGLREVFETGGMGGPSKERQVHRSAGHVAPIATSSFGLRGFSAAATRSSHAIPFRIAAQASGHRTTTTTIKESK